MFFFFHKSLILTHNYYLKVVGVNYLIGDKLCQFLVTLESALYGNDITIRITKSFQ